jgi:hypothetical protein
VGARVGATVGAWKQIYCSVITSHMITYESEVLAGIAAEVEPSTLVSEMEHMALIAFRTVCAVSDDLHKTLHNATQLTSMKMCHTSLCMHSYCTYSCTTHECRLWSRSSCR